jgi:hypothetical protein
MIAGGKDFDVPADIVTTFFEQAKKASQRGAFPTPSFVMIEDADHYNLVDAKHEAWQIILKEITARVH